MNKHIVNFAPQPQSLRAEHQKNIGWQPALFELIDNSLDAGATTISIEIDTIRRWLRISDDGSGCSDISRLFRQGDRKDHDTTESGFYGVGGKAAALYFWGRYTVTSYHSGVRQSASVDWTRIEETGWDLEVTSENDAHGIGTAIEISDHQRAAPKPDRLRAFLADHFWPAIESGTTISITINGVPLPLAESNAPSVQDRIEFAGEIGGLAYHGWAGLAVGTNPKPGLTLVKAHRVVRQSWNDCFGEQDISRMYGVVYMDDRRWKLSTFKDDVAESGEALGEAIASELSDLVSRAHALSRDVFLDDISEEFTDLFGGKSRLRNAGSTNGSAKPKNTGASRTDTVKDDPGVKGAKGGVVRVLPARLGERLGNVRVQTSRGKKTFFVDVSEDRPDVAAALANRDKAVLRLLTVSLLANHLAHNEQDFVQRTFPDIEDQERGERFIRLLGAWFHRVIKAAP